MEEKNQVSEGMRARLSAFSGDAGIAVWGTDNGFCLDAGGEITVSVRQEKEGLKGKRMRIAAHNSAPVTVIL